MLRAITLEMRALVYGPDEAELLSEILQGESIEAGRDEVADALARLAGRVGGLKAAMRTEEQENDYYRTLLPLLLPEVGVRDATDAFLLRLVEQVHEYHGYWSLYPEAPAVLSHLQQMGLTLGIVANWAPSLARFVREFELDGFFTAVVSSAQVGARKPDPHIFRVALRQMGVGPDAALHVGPSVEEDVSGALAASVRPVWLDRTGGAQGLGGLPGSPGRLDRLDRRSDLNVAAEAPPAPPDSLFSINSLTGLLLLARGATESE